MIKLIAIDLDGTLLKDDKTISPEDKEAVAWARAQGVRVVLASGRTLHGMIRFARALDLDCDGEFFVVSNGAGIYEGGSLKPLFRAFLSPEAIRFMMDTASEYREELNLQIYVGDRILVDRYLPSTALYAKLAGTPVTEVESLEPYAEAEMLKAVLVSSVPEERMKAIQHSLAPRMPEDLKMFQSAEFLLECVSTESGKWTSVQKVANILNIQTDEILCIGDNENDAEMVCRAGVGACPSNANPAVIEVADYVAVRDNNHGGVAEIINRMLNRPAAG
ncbi:MAG: HAD family phosphatase [Firmicutes bacterium]|nr:HAD family phosphatase [Bacillota bacterium]